MVDEGADPVAVLVLRAGRVESRHRVAACVADASGRVVLAVGDVGRPVFPRSAVKPLQALALVASGAADRFGLDTEEIALACASHRGEPAHTERIARWLARIGASEADLACGVHRPGDPATAGALAAAGRAPGALHNNCSGKHTGMLTLARHLGVPISGYLDPAHPVQRRIRGAIETMSGAALGPPGIDGCGVPNWPMPLSALATALARLADSGPAAGDLAGAALRIVAAMRAHPELVGGSGHPDTLMMRAVPGLVTKTGAEGVHGAALPGRRLGLAVKVEDGAGRAAVVALLALLGVVGALGAAARERLGDLARPVLRNHAGTVVGAILPRPGWPRPRV